MLTYGFSMSRIHQSRTTYAGFLFLLIMAQSPDLPAEKQALILALFGIAYGLAFEAFDLGLQIGTETQARATAYCASFTVGLWASIRVVWAMPRGFKKVLILPALFFHLLLMVGMVWEIFNFMN